MKFCPVVPEICHGQVRGPRKERRKKKENNNNNNNKKQSKNNKSPKQISQTLFGRLKNDNSIFNHLYIFSRV